MGKGLDEEDEHKERQVRRLAGGRSLVLECPHPDTHPLIRERTVAPDPDSGGVLVLDPTPNKYRLVSTRDPTIIYFPKEVEKVVVMDAWSICGFAIAAVLFVIISSALS